MAVTAKFYSLFFESLMEKRIDLENDTFKVMLCTSSYTPDQDTHKFKSDVTNEVSGTGYTAGGATVAGGLTISYNASTNVLSFDGADVSWTGATLIGANAPRYAVLYDDTATDDPLVGYVDFGDDSYAPNGGTLSIAWNASGIGAVTIS